MAIFFQDSRGLIHEPTVTWVADFLEEWGCRESPLLIFVDGRLNIQQ
jgi:hypothetical protein